MAFRLIIAALALALIAAGPAAAADTGGSDAPATGGGVAAGVSLRSAAPRAAELALAPARLRAGGRLTIGYKVEAGARFVDADLLLTRRGAVRPSVRIPLGPVRTGRRATRVWRGAAGRPAPGVYVAALVAEDRHGRRATRYSQLTVLRAPRPVPAPPPPAPAAPVTPAPVAAPASAGGVFPVQGAWSLGGESSRFGAPRDRHVHQGQDIAAAAGTAVVAPMAGTVTSVAFQAAGAGHYVILQGIDGRAMAFMHLQADSIPVAIGTPVAAGQLLGRVGATGTASGPHLHFELWPGGWRSSPSALPIDPLPDLLAWAGTR